MSDSASALPNGRALSDVLGTFALAAQGSERISVGDLMRALGERSMAAMLLVLALPMVAPVPAPGISAAFGVPMAFIAAQLALRRPQLWLPAALERRSISRASFVRIVETALPFLRRTETIVQPRVSWLAGHWSAIPVGLVCLLLSIVIALPVPFGNVVPGMAVVVLALGLMERDGIVVGVGLCVAVTSLALAVLASIGLARIVW